MAQGDLLGTLTNNAVSITNPFSATGSVTVAVGDLVFCVLGEQDALTVTAVSDNLGNTYSACNAGSTGGSVNTRAFYSRVTTAGTLTSVSATTTASVDNVVFVAAVFTGPFAVSPLDANPSDTLDDFTSPFTCPATGTLAQASEVVLCFFGQDSGAAVSATSPNLKAIQTSSSSVISVTIGYQTVVATTSVAPAFTRSGGPSSSVLGTASFKLGFNAYTLTALVGSYTLTGVAAFQQISMNSVGGAYVLTGIAAILSKGYILVAALGTYTLTGINATLQAIRTMAAAVGAYTLTGIAAFQQISMNSAVGSYILTGVATLQKLTMNAIAGAYTYTGVAAVLSWGRFLTAAVGTYTLTGIAALQRITMNAIAGAYTYTGQNATLQAVRTMAAAAGTYVYTGVAAILTSGRTLSAAAGTYVYTGVSAVLAKGVQNLAYRVRRVVDPVLAKVRASAPALFKRRVEAPKLRKTRVSDPSLFK